MWRDRWRISACDSSSSLVTCHDPILNSVSRWNLSWVAPVKRQLLVFCFRSRNNLLSSGRSNCSISVYFMTTLLPKLNGIYVCFAIPEYALQVLCSDMRRPISDPWVDRTSHTTDTLPTPYMLWFARLTRNGATAIVAVVFVVTKTLLGFDNCVAVIMFCEVTARALPQTCAKRHCLRQQKLHVSRLN